MELELIVWDYMLRSNRRIWVLRPQKEGIYVTGRGSFVRRGQIRSQLSQKEDSHIKIYGRTIGIKRLYRIIKFIHQKAFKRPPKFERLGLKMSRRAIFESKKSMSDFQMCRIRRLDLLPTQCVLHTAVKWFVSTRLQKDG